MDAKQLIIVEAPIDALSLAMCGHPSIALCGTTGPDWLPNMMAFRRVFLAFDADEPNDKGERVGDKAAAILTTKLQSFGAVVTRLRPEYGKDWNEILSAYGSDEIRRQIAALSGLKTQISPLALLASLEKRGVTWQVGEEIIYFRGAEVLTEVQIATLRCRKAELLLAIQAAPAQIPPEPVAQLPNLCSVDRPVGVAVADARLEAISDHAEMATTADEDAALLAYYRRGGAILSLESVDYDGAQKLALAVELASRIAPEKHARAFAQIERDGLQIVRALELEAKSS